MPGATIGTKLNEPSETVWEGRILIRRTGREHKVEYQYENGDPRVATIVHAHLQDVIKQLNPRE